MTTSIKQRMAEQLERDLRGRNCMPDPVECEAIVEGLFALMRELESREHVPTFRGRY